MDISGNDLVTEYRRAVQKYPFLITMERSYRLPPFMLFAVGSRETNLTNEVGDGGHGHGMFQLDNRSHTIPEGFDGDVRLQAETACKMLASLIKFWPGDLKAAMSSYNTGTYGARQGISDSNNSDEYTANGNYGKDVLQRTAYLLGVYGNHLPTPRPPVVPKPHKQLRYRVESGDTLTSIARTFHTTWHKLYRLNRRTIGNNPNLIFVGESLIVPGR